MHYYKPSKTYSSRCTILLIWAVRRQFCPILLYDSLWYKTMPERTLGQSDKLKNKTADLVPVLRSVDK
jgi:hypothetical protein